MNILHICTSSRGGAAQSAIRLHKGLLKIGVNSKFLFQQNHDREIANSFQFKTKVDSLSERLLKRLKREKTLDFVHKQKLMGKVAGFEVFTFPESKFDITASEVYQSADIINLHWVSNFIDYESFFRKNRKPVIWTLHDMNPFTGGCHYSSGSEGFKKDCGNCIQLDGTSNPGMAKENLSIKRRSLNNNPPLQIVTPSKWLFNQSAASTILRSFPHHHIPYGLDTTVFKPVSQEFCRTLLNLPLDKKILLFVSDRIENKRKGFHLLLETLKQMKNEDPDIVICSVGNYSSADSTIDSINLGPIKDERLMGVVYNAADLFMLPSLEDNLPNVMLEALACGTPVIGFNNGGIPDLIKNNETGWLVESGDIKEFAVKTLEILNNDSDRIRMGKKGREMIEQKYTLEIQAKKYLELYQGLSHRVG